MSFTSARPWLVCAGRSLNNSVPREGTTAVDNTFLCTYACDERKSFSQSNIDKNRIALNQLPLLTRIVIAIDPAVCRFRRCSQTQPGAAAFDTIIAVTDRTNLDQQIRDTIRQFAQVGATVTHADHSGDLRRFIEAGKKIVISTVQKFPYILDDIGSIHRDRRFAIIIDEAHSSQSESNAAALNRALAAGGAAEDEETVEDTINRIMESRKLLPNASYFAFTATPKNKTLEIFGIPFTEGDEVKHRPFHNYTMKQALASRSQETLSDSRKIAMPRGSKPGERRGGRQKGSLNKLSIGSPLT